jgi:hypothetical protein
LPDVDLQFFATAPFFLSCAFALIYLLSTLSIKFYVHELFGTKPPAGTEGGIMSILETPAVQRMAESAGLDISELEKKKK